MGRELRGVEIVDTFAEAFDMRASRVIITAATEAWARTAAVSMTGFATSVIGCKVEAGIEAMLAPGDTPDGRPGASVLVFAFNAEGLATRLVERVGQTVLTCVTTACFDGLPDAPERATVGGVLRHFGDKFQSSKVVDGRRYWRVPVMEGEFLVEETFGTQSAIGGGNLLILAKDQAAALAAAEASVDAMRQVRGVILPFPGGIVRCRQQGRREALQEHDRVDQRGVLPDGSRPARCGERAAGGGQLGAGDRHRRRRSSGHRRRDAPRP